MNVRGSRRDRPEERVRLEHRVRLWPDVGDLVIVIHDPERVEPGAFGRARRFRYALEHPIGGNALEGEARQLQTEVRHDAPSRAARSSP
jgi:hypothetical protein